MLLRILAGELSLSVGVLEIVLEKLVLLALLLLLEVLLLVRVVILVVVFVLVAPVPRRPGHLVLLLEPPAGVREPSAHLGQRHAGHHREEDLLVLGGIWVPLVPVEPLLEEHRRLSGGVLPPRLHRSSRRPREQVRRRRTSAQSQRRPQSQRARQA